MIRKQQEFTRGVRAGLPISLSYFPIAVAFGALAVQADLTWFEATLMSLLVFAGASQFVSISMLLAGAGMLQIIAATFILNLRHLIMSLTVQARIRFFPQAWKNLLSFGITDETFALLTLGGREEGSSGELTPRYVLGLMSTAYLGWVSGSAAGGLGAGFVPESITTSMTVGLYAMFIGLLVPAARESKLLAGIALVSMAANTILGRFLESGWSIVISTLTAAGLGALVKEERE